MAIQTQVTDFTRDVVGRYVCNRLDEALASADRNRHPDARPFDMIILGGGTFGSALASHLFTPVGPPDKSRGEAVYVAKCAVCHGRDGQGLRGPSGDYLFPPLWGHNRSALVRVWRA